MPPNSFFISALACAVCVRLVNISDTEHFNLSSLRGANILVDMIDGVNSCSIVSVFNITGRCDSSS